MGAYQEVSDFVLTGNLEKVKETITKLIDEGKSPMEIITDGLIGGISLVGQKWKAGDMFLPEVIMSSKAMNAGMELLRPRLSDEKLSEIYRGKVIIGTVEGDIHSIGKNIVSMVLQSGGFIVVDLGVDVPAIKFIDAVESEKPDILGLSALLTLTVPRMSEVIGALTERHLRDKVRIMVGGAPINQEFADSIGADAYASDAISALEKARQLLDR